MADISHSGIHEWADTLLKDITAKALAQSIRHVNAREEVLKEIAEEGSMHVEAIKLRMGQAIVEQELEDWITQGTGTWFDVHEYKAGKETISEVNLSGQGGFYKANQAFINNHMPSGGTSNSGRYGSFFESIFFGGGAGNDPIPDFRYNFAGAERGIELKSGTLKGAAFIIDKLRQTIIRKIDTDFFSQTVGSRKNLLGVISFLKTAGNVDEAMTKIARAVFLDKYMTKMKNLMIAGVSVNQVSGKVFDKEVGRFVESRGTFFFTALYLFYHLLLQKLVDHATKNIVITKNIKFIDRGLDEAGKLKVSSKTIGGSVKLKTTGSGDTFELAEIEVLVAASNLPREEGILTKAIMNDPKIFYAGMTILYDDTIAGKTSKSFFEEAISKHKKGNSDYKFKN